MDFLKLMQERYTAKYYKADKKIPAEIMDKLLECLRLTPTAVNAQLWHFYVLESAEAKAKIRPAIPDFNEQRFDGCSAVIVLCGERDLEKADFDRVSLKEVADGRWIDDGQIVGKRSAGMKGFAKSREAVDGFMTWTGKQTYLAMATLLYAAQSYGIDSTPIEGVDIAKVDELMELKAKNQACMSLVLLGYRSDDDSNTLDKRPKSRLALEDIVTRL